MTGREGVTTLVIDIREVWVSSYVERHTKKLLGFSLSSEAGKAYCNAKCPDLIYWKHYDNKIVGIPHWHNRTVKGYYIMEKVTQL